MWDCCTRARDLEDPDVKGEPTLLDLYASNVPNGPIVKSLNTQPSHLRIADTSSFTDDGNATARSAGVLSCYSESMNSHRDSDRDNQVQPQGLTDISFEFPWSELEMCTANFAPDRLLGSGRAGGVYHGMLEEGTQVAAKVMEGVSMTGFDQEIRLLSRCRHPNVVLLVGFAIADAAAVADNGSMARASKVALLYELLPGGTASGRLLSCHSSVTPYRWKQRLEHAVEATRGLAHLHRQKPKIFHRDIKTSNILFAKDGTAKIADFGLACASTSGEGAHATAKWANSSLGYRDPLYEKTTIMTESNEVYSMGMVLIEFLTGRPPCTRNESCIPQFLINDLKLQYDNADDERLASHADSQAQWSRRTAKDLGALAGSCIHPDVRKRPAFRDLAVLLQAMSTTGGHFKPICNGSFAHRAAESSKMSLGWSAPGTPSEASGEFSQPKNRFLDQENRPMLNGSQ